MPNIATPEAPSIKPVDVLSFGEQSPRIPDNVLSGRLQEARQRAQSLREQREAGRTGRQVLEAQRDRSSTKTFDAKNVKGLELRFGAGAAYEAGSSVQLDAKLKPTSEQKASFEQGKTAAEQVGKVLLYTEVAAEQAKTGKSPTEILKEKGIKETWDKVREDALGTILQNDMLQQAIPELQDFFTKEVQMQFIEAALVKDPQLRTKIVEKMRDISERASSLPEVRKDQETEEAKVLQAQAETQMQSGWGKMKQTLEAEGYDVSKLAGSQAEIDKLIKEGVALPQIASRIRETLLQNGQFSDRKNIELYINLQKKKEEIEVKLQKSIKGSESERHNGAELARVTAELQAADSTFDKTQYENYSKLVSMLGDTDMSGKFGQNRGQIEQDIKQTVAAGGKYASAEQTIRARSQEVAKLEQKDQAERLRQESELIDALRDVIPDAIAEILLERHDEIVQLEMQRQEKINEQTTSEGVRKVGDAINKNWIEYNDKTREKTVHRDAIGKDVRFAAYHGEEGIRRMILRDMDIGHEDWKDVDLSTLPEEQKKALEDAYTTHGQAYKDKLLGDFFTAKDFRDGGFKVGFKNWKIEGSVGALGLKEHEWKLLEQNFGKDLDKRLESSQEGAKMIQEMKDRKIVPNFKSKWLMYLLLLLGGVGTVVAGPLAGVVAVGAAGAAGKSSAF